MNAFCEISCRGMPRNKLDAKSTLVQVLAWYRQATNYYLSQCWPQSMSPYGVTKPQLITTPHKLCLLVPSVLWNGDEASVCIWSGVYGVFIIQLVLIQFRVYNPIYAVCICTSDWRLHLLWVLKFPGRHNGLLCKRIFMGVLVLS